MLFFRYKMRDLESLEPSIDHNVTVRVINSPTDFWCQMSDNSYEYLQEKLSESYLKDSAKLQQVEDGSKCVVKLNEKEFFRGSVLGSDLDEDRVTVLCVDNGYIHEIAQSDLLEYKLEFEKFPQLAFLSALDIKTTTSEGEWNKEICDKFKEIVLECSEVEELPAYARVNIVRLEDDTVVVRLTIDRLVIGDHLIKLDMAELCDKIENLEIKEMKSESSEDVTEFGRFRNFRLQEDSEHNLFVVDCDSLDELVFHTKDSGGVIEEITEKIAEYVKDRETSEDNDSWKEGDCCLCKCPDDGLWYRANVLTLVEDKHQVS